MDNMLEDMEHTLTTCYFLPFAFHTINKCIPNALSGPPTYALKVMKVCFSPLGGRRVCLLCLPVIK